MKKGLERKPLEFIEGIGTKTRARDFTMINKFSIHHFFCNFNEIYRDKRGGNQIAVMLRVGYKN